MIIREDWPRTADPALRTPDEAGSFRDRAAGSVEIVRTLGQRGWASDLRLFATMLRLNQKQRTALGDTLRQLANLVAGGLIVGQFVRPQAPSFWLAVAGVAVWFAFVGIALWLQGGAGNGQSHA